MSNADKEGLKYEYQELPFPDGMPESLRTRLWGDYVAYGTFAFRETEHGYRRIDPEVLPENVTD